MEDAGALTDRPDTLQRIVESDGSCGGSSRCHSPVLEEGLSKVQKVLKKIVRAH